MPFRIAGLLRYPVPELITVSSDSADYSRAARYGERVTETAAAYMKPRQVS